MQFYLDGYKTGDPLIADPDKGGRIMTGCVRSASVLAAPMAPCGSGRTR